MLWDLYEHTHKVVTNPESGALVTHLWDV